MSQENSYYQVKSIQTLRTPGYAESVASIVKDLINNAPLNVISNVQKLNSFQVVTPSTDILKSPQSLKILQKHFNQNLTILNRNPLNDDVANLKAAAIMTLHRENLQVENKAVVVKSIGELLNTTTLKQAKQKLSSAFYDIKSQHLNVFKDTLSSTVEKASSNIGFESIKTNKISTDLIRIVATHSKGYNLISEIHIDKSNKVDIVSGLINITDGSCVKIMDDFNKELENFGIVAERKERKPTGGIAQLPFAKKLQEKHSNKKREFLNEQVIKKIEKEKQFNIKNNL